MRSDALEATFLPPVAGVVERTANGSAVTTEIFPFLDPAGADPFLPEPPEPWPVPVTVPGADVLEDTAT
jgi:hypothetical protein